MPGKADKRAAQKAVSLSMRKGIHAEEQLYGSPLEVVDTITTHGCGYDTDACASSPGLQPELVEEAKEAKLENLEDSDFARAL